MKIPKNNELLNNARGLRKELTPQERKLWYLFLQKYPVKIYKQRIIGPYIVDFYCASAKLVIEIDGSQHYEESEAAYDQKRTEYLNGLGLNVVRYTTADINVRFNQVCEDIHQRIQKTD